METKAHNKHSSIVRASFGQFARNEIAFLGAPCGFLKDFFAKVASSLPNKHLGVLEQDHSESEQGPFQVALTDKINFRSLETLDPAGGFASRKYYDSLDLLLINGNHFLGKNQVVFIHNGKDFLKKQEKLSAVLFAVKVDEPTDVQAQYLQENTIQVLNFEQFDTVISVIDQFIKSTVPPIAGLLLAGGKSSRMGQDKGQIQYHGLDQREYASGILKSLFPEVSLSLNATQAQEYTGILPVIEDQFLNIGPLGGILSAFKSNPNTAWLVLACDMPYLSEKSINYLLENRNTSAIATCFKSDFDGFPEPLCTIFEPKAYPILLEMLAYGYDCPRKALINYPSHVVEHPNSIELNNVNTPDQLTEAFIKLNPRLA
jgi:molybdenum cofactor guanylyltransferase